jgi:hypothetical protein
VCVRVCVRVNVCVREAVSLSKLSDREQEQNFQKGVEIWRVGWVRGWCGWWARKISSKTTSLFAQTQTRHRFVQILIHVFFVLVTRLPNARPLSRVFWCHSRCSDCLFPNHSGPVRFDSTSELQMSSNLICLGDLSTTLLVLLKSWKGLLGVYLVACSSSTHFSTFNVMVLFRFRLDASLRKPPLLSQCLWWSRPHWNFDKSLDYLQVYQSKSFVTEIRTKKSFGECMVLNIKHVSNPKIAVSWTGAPVYSLFVFKFTAPAYQI